MIDLTDRSYAQYLYGGETIAPEVMVQPPDVIIAKRHLYLGILTPKALSQLNSPQSDMRLEGAPSGYLYGLFQGMFSGADQMPGGIGWQRLSDTLRGVCKAPLAIKTDDSFRQHYYFLRAQGTGWCLPFELALQPGREISIRSDPFNMSVSQDGGRIYEGGFLTGKAVRIGLRDASQSPHFDLTVAT